MRIILTFILFVSLNLRSENTPTVALTAGSEFSPVQLMDGESITQGYTCEVNPLAWTCEHQIEPQLNSYTARTANAASGSKDKTILLAGLLIAIALYYVTKKSIAKRTNDQTLELAKINFEEEEKQELKKEVWNLMATQGTIETETTRENIIATKPETYSKHSYNCLQGKLTIEQAYQNPNIGEGVWLNNLPAPNGKYKIGLLLSVEVVDGKISKVFS